MDAVPHRRFGWLRSHWGLVVAITIGLLWVQIISQLFFPYDTALPGAKLYGKWVNGKSRSALAETITDGFMKQSVTLKTATTNYKTSLSGLGASVDADTAASALTNYPLWQRFLPFSVLWVRPEVSQFTITFSSSVLRASSVDAAAKLSAEPVDAALAIKKGDLVVTKAKDGQTVNANDLEKAIRETKFSPTLSTIEVKATAKAPKVADASVAEVKKQAEAILAQDYNFVSESGKQITPSINDVTGWLQITTSGTDVKVSPNKKGIASYIASLNASLGTSGTPAQVRMVDGVETSRKAGSLGSAIQSSDLQAKIIAAINDGGASTMQIVMQPVAPADSVARSYTSSQKGLQAYVSYVASSEHVEIALSQLGGSGWTAYGNAYASEVSASTYKLYVATWVASQIKAGKMKLSDSMLGTTVQGCLERMIVVSDNACAEAWVKKAGGTNLNNFLYAKNISKATTFVAADATHTSAADLQKVTLGIWNGTMISGSLRSTILGYMNRQVYRQGIPAGSKGSVYDKVGFLWDYLNDSAIVVHPKGTYSLVIMTKGSSWGHIAEITRQLENIMYP
jgi:beta-lactamase class A